MKKIIAPIFGILAVITLIAIIPYFNKQIPCANTESCTKNMNVAVENDALGTFNGQAVTPPKIDLLAESKTKRVLGEKTSTGEKHIYVDLTTQTLTAYEGDKLFLKTLVSTGRFDKTPTGDFKIWVRLRATRMSGGSGADYYNLPNVPFTMFFANNEVSAGAGYSLHGVYWHNNFGHTMSHGCVNMRTIDAEKIFNWIDDPEDNPTTVTIYGKSI